MTRVRVTIRSQESHMWDEEWPPLPVGPSSEKTSLRKRFGAPGSVIEVFTPEDVLKLASDFGRFEARLNEADGIWEIEFHLSYD
jgi:hypothetical protein